MAMTIAYSICALLSLIALIFAANRMSSGTLDNFDRDTHWWAILLYGLGSIGSTIAALTMFAIVWRIKRNTLEDET
jgi:NADH:ubiquinone oxidoreductase subunit H